ncbi:M23 family metallopeptidase [Nonomuraea sp. NPDC050310]|uniref:M23 family metallopeptidase n=1 Tax=Nonomuraea sp. NPDC050310 TaxID=3154935 RepID=UPI0033E49FA8
MVTLPQALRSAIPFLAACVVALLPAVPASTAGDPPADPAAEQSTDQPADATALLAVSHKSPFNCGKTFYANNWTGGHNPNGSIDWQNYGGDETNGEPVRATAAGTAYFYDYGNTSYGKWVEIHHSDGSRTRYAHMSSMVRAAGASMGVSQGTQIGNVGATGTSVPHLHYEQRFSGGGMDTSPTVEGVTVSLGQKKAITSTNACGGGTNPYTPQEACGSGYSVVDSAGLSGGTTYLLYNSGNGYNCVVTMKSTNLGVNTAVSAFLEPQGESRVTDAGNFGYYAGPVRLHAAGQCVRWGGSVGSSSYTSPFEHCG